MNNFIANIRVFLSFVKNNRNAILSKFCYMSKEREQDLWVFGEWFGKKCCDNALFLANYVAKNYPHIKTVWVSLEEADLSRLDSSVHKVVMDSEEAISFLKRAGVVIFVQGIMDVTTTYKLYYSGALVVNLWHGVPWKKIGTDICKDRSAAYGMKLYNILYGANLYLALSDRFVEILTQAYGLRGNRIIRSGYPRNSLFYNDIHVRQCRERLLELISSNYDICVDNHTRFILYMPTFRDSNSEVFTFANLSGLNDFLRSENVVILQKFHYVTSERMPNIKLEDENRVIDINSDLISQELLAASDVLVTDYSSCFFDYLLLDRPIIHFLYDFKFYSSVDRGLYYKKEDVVCGDVVEKADDLIYILKENLDNPEKYKALRKERREQFIGFESNDSCKHIYNMIKTFVSVR